MTRGGILLLELNSVKKPFILVAVGLLLYGFSLSNGFVWDDEVLRNHNAVTAQAYFRPVMSWIYATLFTLFGSQPFFFHLFSVGFHIGTALLLFYIFKRFFKENIAFFLSLLFLVHPANVEAVCFASAMQEVLFTFTGLLGLCLLVRLEELSFVTLLTSTALFTAALLMKETGIVFFPLTFFYLLLFHKKNRTALQLFSALSIIILFSYGMARYSGGNMYVANGGLFPIMRISLVERLINIPQIILFYLKTFMFPLHLTIAQNWVIRTEDLQHFWLPLGVEGGILLFVILSDKNYIRRILLRFARFFTSFRMTGRDSSRACPEFIEWVQNDDKKVFLFFFLWFLIGLVPHLQIIPLNMTVAERWMYFSMIGLLGMIGAVCKKDPSHVLKSLRMTKYSFRMTVGVIIITLFFLRSFMRTVDWHSGLALYSSNISITSSFDLQNNMGVELFRVGKYAQAKKYFEKSVKLAPYWWVNWNNLGASYEQEKNFDKAAECYKKSLQNGTYELASENLARILVLHGRDKKKATDFLKKAVSLFPESETLNMLKTIK